MNVGGARIDKKLYISGDVIKFFVKLKNSSMARRTFSSLVVNVSDRQSNRVKDKTLESRPFRIRRGSTLGKSFAFEKKE